MLNGFTHKPISRKHYQGFFLPIPQRKRLYQLVRVLVLNVTVRLAKINGVFAARFPFQFSCFFQCHRITPLSAKVLRGKPANQNGLQSSVPHIPCCHKKTKATATDRMRPRKSQN